MRLSSDGISGTNEDEEKVLKKEKDVLLVFLESLEAVEMWFEFFSHTKYIKTARGSLRRRMGSARDWILMLKKWLLFCLFKDYYSLKNSAPYDKC